MLNVELELVFYEKLFKSNVHREINFTKIYFINNLLVM
jgi:hypothetical protein